MIVRFTKMSGAGNDFIVVDNRGNEISPIVHALAPGWCDRHFGVGADGILLLEMSSGKSGIPRMRFVNPDGSEGMMCGNGGRCFARFIRERGISGSPLSFENNGTIYSAETNGATVRLKFPPITESKGKLTVELESGFVQGENIYSGTDHFVHKFDGDLNGLGSNVFAELGSKLRYHDSFAPRGTNVNFYRELRPGEIILRTYERGVEAETLSCGTGSIAAAFSYTEGNPSRTTVHARSGAILIVEIHEDHSVSLQGDAEIIFTGEIEVTETNAFHSQAGNSYS